MIFFFYLLAAVGFLVKAFVVLHIQSHFADLTAETSFVPILYKKNSREKANLLSSL